MLRRLVVLSLLLCALSGPLAAASADRPTRQVAQAVALLHQAIVQRDGAALQRLADPALSYGHSNGLVEDRQTFIANVIAGKAPFTAIDFASQTVAVTGNVAVVRGVLRASVADAPPPADKIELKVLYVWRHDGKWRLVARQAVR